MKLQLYILRELMLGFTYAVVGMFVLALPAVAVAAVHKLAGLDTRTVLMYLPLLMLNLVPYVLPLGFLLAVVVTYGRLAADQEWTAIRMAGFHPLKMLGPGVMSGFVLALLTFWLIGTQLPRVRIAAKRYQFTALRQMITHLSPGRTELHLGKFYLSAGYRDGDDFLDAFIYIPSRGGEEAKSLLADRVHFQFRDREMFVHLDNPRTVMGDFALSGGRPVVRLNLDELQSESESTYGSMRYKETHELWTALAAAPRPSEKADELIFEINQRRAISSTYFMFLLLGVPTGLLLRKGTQLGALSVAVGYALLYYILSLRLGKQLATSHVLPPLFGAWAVNGLGMGAGCLLLWKALRQ